MSDDIAAPPADPDAERAVLGSVLLNADALERAQRYIDADDFHEPRHADLFRLMEKRVADGLPVAPMALVAEEHQDGAWVATLMEHVPTVANVEWFARRVAELARWRRLGELGVGITQAVRNAARGGTRSAAEVLEYVRQRTEEAGRWKASPRPTGDEMAAELVASIEAADHTRGLTMDLPDLDHLTGGFKAGQLITVGGRPGEGKTNVIVQQAIATGIRRGIPCDVFSVELTRAEFLQRVASALASVDGRAISDNRMDADQRAQVDGAVADISGGSMVVHDAQTMTLAQFCAAGAEAVRAGSRLLLLDYLQILRADPNDRRPRQEQVAHSARTVKLLAQRLNVPILVGAQLNRRSAIRGDGKPTLEDLRESGEIEQSSDKVLLLHSPEDDGERGVTSDILVRKNRQGAKGEAVVVRRFEYSRFENLGDNL